MLATINSTAFIKSFIKGGIISYPTEAVFGIGCDPDNKLAVKKLLKLKQRPREKGLILIASNFYQVEKYLKPLPVSQKKYTQPSNITYIYPTLNTAPKWLTGDFNSLAIRITKHPIARDICLTLNSAIVSTSANISGQPPAITAKEVYEQFGDKIGLIIEGDVGDLLTPTEIRDSITGRIIRS